MDAWVDGWLDGCMTVPDTRSVSRRTSVKGASYCVYVHTA